MRPTQLDEFTLNLLTNDEVIAVNQDRLGIQAPIVKIDNHCTAWAKPLYNGSTALAVVNFGFTEEQTTLTLSELKLQGTKTIRNLWKKENIGTTSDKILIKLSPHACILYSLK